MYVHHNIIVFAEDRDIAKISRKFLESMIANNYNRSTMHAADGRVLEHHTALICYCDTAYYHLYNYLQAGGSLCSPPAASSCKLKFSSIIFA